MTYWKGAKDQFFEAPGQGKMLCELLHQGSDNNVPNDLQILIEKYKDSDSLSQMVILSLVDHDKYIRADIVNYFPGYTKYQVDKARRWSKESTSLSLPTKEKHKRSNLDLRKCEHFLDFIFNSGILQDVAYGVTNIKFDNEKPKK